MYTYKAKMIKGCDVVTIHGNILTELDKVIGELRIKGYDLLKVENVKLGIVIF